MLSAAARVIARSVAIQLEEVAALSATATRSTAPENKGKARAVDDGLEESPMEAIVPGSSSPLKTSTARAFPQTQSLADTLERHEARRNAASGSGSGSSSSTRSALSPLDRLIQQSPRAPPPPAPDTHPSRKYEAERAAREQEKALRGSRERTPKVVKPASTGKKFSLDELIRNAPHAPPPPAPASHPDRKLEKELNEAKKMRARAAAAAGTDSATAMAPLAPDPSESRTEATPALAKQSSSSGVPEPAADVPSSVADQPAVTNVTMEATPDTVIQKSSPTPEPAAEPMGDAAALPSEPVEKVETIRDILADPGVNLPAEEDDTPVVLRASKVPSSRIGRLFHYGSLAASLSFGAASESIRRTTGGTKSGGSVFMSDANIRRLVATLGRMRGAALKLGQFMSIQDNHMLPPEIERVLHQVQAHANYMPDWQMEKVMREEFGSDWQSLFTTFERTPIASASIGQVHRATLASDGTAVAVKIQFPGVASSIESDLSNLSLLLRSSALLPKGLYLQNTIAVMRRELQDECDYVKEAAAGRKFGDLLAKDDYFTVPKVVEEATTGRVLTTEWMDGKPLSKVKGLSQEERDRIGTNILRLCLMELFQFRFMQTDPNWANFLYSSSSTKPGHESIQLIDFGASREYTKEFMDGWYRLLKSCLDGDRVKMKDESLSLGYLTGEENDLMLEAHLDSMALVASPFSHPGKYPFAKQTITESVRGLIPIMLKHRLTPPPQETYSLNRKLSGAFLMCAKLGANVDCQKLWDDVVGDYKQG
ncbi:hypothetical protein IAU60_005320 [Kwoniella sp. DSM 27419]